MKIKDVREMSSEELNNQDTLTIVEQEELDKLLLQEASLER